MDAPPPAPPSPARATFLALTLLAGLAASAALVAGHVAGGEAARVAGGEAARGPGTPGTPVALAGAGAVLAAVLLVVHGVLLVSLRRRLAAAEGRAAALAREDDLTGVANRRAVLERLGDELARARRYGRPLSVALLDVDGLARVNAAVGADGGDAVLRAVAQAVRAQLRRSDAVGRLRDDELLTVLPETGGEGARVIAERLRYAVEHLAVPHAGISLGASASLGVATWTPETGPDLPEAEALLREADEALFRAKSAGRNQVA